jgi:hypothetical protein
MKKKKNPKNTYYRLGCRRTRRLGWPENMTLCVVGGLPENRTLWVPGGSSEIETRRTGRERRATEGERETERDRRGMDDGSPGLREKWEREGENGGKMKPRVFLSSIQKFKIFFFFWADVEDATSARDGRRMDARRTLRITRGCGCGGQSHKRNLGPVEMVSMGGRSELCGGGRRAEP